MTKSSHSLRPPLDLFLDSPVADAVRAPAEQASRALMHVLETVGRFRKFHRKVCRKLKRWYGFDYVDWHLKYKKHYDRLMGLILNLAERYTRSNLAQTLAPPSLSWREGSMVLKRQNALLREWLNTADAMIKFSILRAIGLECPEQAVIEDGFRRRM
ncbi:hypothetical protein MMC20_000171 [Loxospora ochrophaea]|nr:hypothetical protein [Loxospora ochrophaea]